MRYERKQINSIVGSDERVELNLVTNMTTGKSHLELSKTLTQRFKTKDLESVKLLLDDLMGGGGRQTFNLEELARMGYSAPVSQFVREFRGRSKPSRKPSKIEKEHIMRSKQNNSI